jgi:hypothetical protein
MQIVKAVARFVWRYRGAVIEFGLPVVVFYVLHLEGASDFVALFAGAVAAGLRVVWTAIQYRRWNMFSTLMMLTFGLSLALSVVSHEPRFLLLKGCLTTGLSGIAFLLSLLIGHPLSLGSAQAFQLDRAQEMAEQYRTNPLVRHAHRVSTLVWGLGLIVEASVQVPVIYLLPISYAVGVSTLQSLIVLTILIVWSLRYEKRLELAAPAVVAKSEPEAPTASAAPPSALPQPGDADPARPRRTRSNTVRVPHRVEDPPSRP